MQKKRKGPKGPNPLSMKKKKLPEVSARSSQSSKAGLSNAPSCTTVLSGQKRKCDSQDVYEGQGVGISDGAVGRKRKRRRKPSTVPPSSP